ncbi:Lrp/AsnC family transcriptional regulator [Helcobacillus massiliensis]|uniref:Lrp/AsnC family transcriptional regulator n=1 Tax=Helcobacillus massiliensis TaxID=521392 RepID=UPI0021A72CC5|nr:Lrp/AsnC family transcriptional regulator [Helcobacillus massiliensis]MCT1556815.1 Lrp/AsnC family transcriptional regulator [Helcobacillus massiliensis]MCT2035639.1 Lrp/AsnC family transcriptional regulator [Helcobacillus massiliensis]MCT2330909.1 Lrp/AsnC family transcriptional regulator [Helcobacillus massiliensis]MDK7741264.1 Lrp/AsnC family transcriptional regulator [Helcobacillus massiliensis]WOO92882.1 Lrp/AsnC family transcriptional regulator [Helcobacillus massiliensis]
MPALSEFDRSLISLLRKDGRMPIATLAAQLGVSRTTVTKRLERLESRGVIVGYTVRVRDEGELDQIRSVTHIAVGGVTTTTVIERLRGMPEIAALHTTNGNWDLVAEISCRDLTHFDQVLREIRNTSGVENSHSSLLLSSVVRH